MYFYKDYQTIFQDRSHDQPVLSVGLPTQHTLAHLTHCGEVRCGIPLQYTPVALSALEVALDGAVISGVGHV